MRHNTGSTKPEDVESLKEEITELEVKEKKVSEEIQQLINE